MLKKRFVYLLAAVFVVSFSAAAMAQEAATQAGPRLTLVDPLKDFGTVARGTKLEWDFTLKNTGDKPLEILSVQPTCGCTVAEFDRAIQPGATGKVHAVVDTTQFSGPISKGITVTSNDPTQPAAQLTMRAIVKPYVDAYPAGFMRFMVLEGESASQTAILFTEEEAPFQIVDVVEPSEDVKVDVVKIEKPEEIIDKGRPKQAQYKINVTFTGNEKNIGPIAQKLKIVTNSAHAPEYTLNLSGLVRPGYLVNPGALNFGEVSSSDPAATRTITVRTNRTATADQFKVTKVESSNAAVSAEAKPGTAPGVYDVTVKVNQGAKAGALDGDVKIYTTDPTRPVFTLPLSGSIKA
ncbi:MAG TPA: DUF1573 domain-containing protein [Thermoanaerobaculia bacterium]|nr:DUF1573 domain-containing protein [Thermoanaerobaculia bacterium]